MIRHSTQLLLGLLAFVRATVIGGVFVLAPIAVLVAIIGQAVSIAFGLVHPLIAYLPFQSVAGVSLTLITVIAALIALCFLAGLLANTAIANWLVKSIESAVLANLPGYALMKSMGEGLVGLQSDGSRRAVLVHFEHSAQIGFQMDELPDGRAVVFIPGVPSPWSGQLHIVPGDRYEPLGAPVREAIECLQRMGLHSARVLDRHRTRPDPLERPLPGV